MKRLRVWGWTGFPVSGAGQCRIIVATRTKKEAYMHYRGSRYEFDTSAYETWNSKELAVALAKPGIAFYRLLDDYGGKFKRVPK